MDIEFRPIESIKPYAANPRHNDAAVDVVADSIRRFGFRQPVVVDRDGVIIVGHTRYKAASKLGLTQVPVHVADLTPEQAKAYRLIDNQSAALSSWDEALLAGELRGLEGMEFDITSLGFSEEELSHILQDDGKPGLTDPDDIPPLPQKAVTLPGDLWVLGDHRLLCGDSTNAEDVKRLLDGAVPFLMVTDPPYGVQYDPQWRHRAGINHNDKRRGQVANDDRADWTNAYALFPGRVAYIWHAPTVGPVVDANLISCGFKVRSLIVWRKPRFVLSRGHYHWQHESALYGVRDNGPAKWCGDRSQSTIWDIAQKDDGEETVHGTQKPVECMSRPIRNHGGKGDEVYDPFLGSGTTIIAAEQLGRRCFGMEVDPRYVDVSVKRWESFTGKKAERLKGKATPKAHTKHTPARAGVRGKKGAA